MKKFDVGNGYYFIIISYYYYIIITIIGDSYINTRLAKTQD